MPGKPLPVWPHSHCRTLPPQDSHVDSGNRAPSLLLSHGRKLRLAQAAAADGPSDPQWHSRDTVTQIITIHIKPTMATPRCWTHPAGRGMVGPLHAHSVKEGYYGYHTRPGHARGHQ